MSGGCTKAVPLGEATWTSTTCPSGTSRLGQAVLVPVGQVVLVPNLSHWDWQMSKEAHPFPMDKSYTHAGGLSLSQDKLYDHDGTCPSPTCPNLSHKVGLQGSEMLRIFGNTAGFDRLGSISFICTVVKLTRVTFKYNPQIRLFVMCSKDVALVEEWEQLHTCCS